MSKFIDLTGQVFGRLAVLRRSTSVFLQPVSAVKEVWWACRCSCGMIVDVRGKSLRCGDTQSCGCLHEEITVQRSMKGPSAIEIFEDHAEIDLCDKKGEVVDHAVIDTADVPLLQNRRWFKTTNGYAASAAPFFVHLHRLLLPKANRVEHRNQHKLDCRRDNLRLCTSRRNEKMR